MFRQAISFLSQQRIHEAILGESIQKLCKNLGIRFYPVPREYLDHFTPSWR